MKTEEQLIFESSKELRKTLQTPYSISTMLSAFEKSIAENSTSSQANNNQYFEPNSLLQSVFNRLKRREKIQHYSLCVSFLS